VRKSVTRSANLSNLFWAGNAGPFMFLGDVRSRVVRKIFVLQMAGNLSAGQKDSRMTSSLSEHRRYARCLVAVVADGRA
jgi:hypothetical protein